MTLHVPLFPIHPPSDGASPPRGGAFARPIFATRVLPVVALDDADLAVPLAEALLEGGIDALEITLRTPCAFDAIAAVARAVPGMQVGAGSLLNADDVPHALDAGAGYLLSPGCTPKLVEAAIAAGRPFVPGVMTPGEAMRARDWGFTLLKLFPAMQAGGPAMLRALAGPLPDLSFCPTGGIDAGNFADFLRQPNVAMVGGSWLTPPQALRQQDWGTITLLARQACVQAETIDPGK